MAKLVGPQCEAAEYKDLSGEEGFSLNSVVVDSIPHNSTKAIVKKTLEEAVAADTISLSRKTARSPKGNVDVEPLSSIDDSSVILIEIGVDV